MRDRDGKLDQTELDRLPSKSGRRADGMPVCAWPVSWRTMSISVFTQEAGMAVQKEAYHQASPSEAFLMKLLYSPPGP